MGFQGLETLETAPIIYIPSNLPQQSEPATRWSLDGPGWQETVDKSNQQYQTEMQPATGLSAMDFNSPATGPWDSQIMTPQRMETIQMKEVSHLSQHREIRHHC
jgi:hypothetical protein